MLRMMKKMTECARSAVMLDEGVSKCFDIIQYVNILQGIAQGCTLSPYVFKIYVSEMIVAVEVSKLKESQWGKIRCRG